MKRRIVLVVLAVAAAVLASCSNPFVGKGKTGSGSVIVKFAQAGTAGTTLASRALSAGTARTIVPGIDANADSYKITLTSGGFPTQTILLLKANLSSSPSYTFPTVEVGTWDVTVEAQKAGMVFGRGTITGQVVSPNQANSTPVIPVYPVDAALSGGTGNISFTIGIYDGSSAWSANLELFDATDTTPIAGTQQGGLTFAPNDSHDDLETTYSLTGIASGTYALEVSLFKGGVLAGKYLEAVNVWNGLTSNQWLGPNGDGGWSLQPYRGFTTAELLESNADLFSLAILGSDGTTLVTIPSSITNYDLGQVTKGQTITFSAIQAALQSVYVASLEPPASLTYTWNGSAPRSLANTWESVTWDINYYHHVFNPCPPLPLKSGVNTLVATVTSPDGRNTKTYTVTMEWTPSYTSSTSIEMVSVSGGSFQRDATQADISTVSNFTIGKYEITQAQWIAVVGTYPDDMNDVIPRTSVTWFDMVGFCNKLSQVEGLDPVYTIKDMYNNLWPGTFPVATALYNIVTADWTKNGYRLPTEMEYMWAAMGGLKAAGYVGGSNGVNTTGYLKEFAGDPHPTVFGDPIGDYAWYQGNNNTSVTTVGTKLPNELGLYDMSGNAWAMCWDLSDVLPSGTLTDYTGAASGTDSVIRGGSFEDTSLALSDRSVGTRTSAAYNNVGFRVARGVPASTSGITTVAVQPVSFVISGPGLLNGNFSNDITYAVVGQTFDSYSWYVNGVQQVGQNSSTFPISILAGTIPVDFLVGKNRIMAIVRKNATYYSEELNVVFASQPN